MYGDHRHSDSFSSAAPRLAIVAGFALASLFGATQPGIAQFEGTVQSKLTRVASNDHIAVPKAPEQVELPAAPPIKYVPGLAEPLVAMGPVTEQENDDLDRALNEFRRAPAGAGKEGDFSDYAKPLLGYIDAHPKSAWNVALLINIGLGYNHAGYFTQAFDYLDKGWQGGREAATTPEARLLVDRAVGEVARIHARLGHDKELESLLAEIHDRPIGGPATELIQSARESLWMFRNNPEISFLCGPAALRNLLTTMRASAKQIEVARAARSGSHGFTLEQLAALAEKANLKYKLVHREPGQPVPVPSIINWKTHHYAAITGTQESGYLVLDPTFGDAGGEVLTTKAIDAESSGYFLVPDTGFLATTDWRIVSPHSKEAKAVYGMGNANHSQKGATKTTNRKMSRASKLKFPTKVICNTCGGLPSIYAPVNHAPTTNSSSPMTVANAQLMVVGLNLQDTPVGYMPQKGLPAQVTISYNQRESEQPATFSFSNLSSKWSHNWMSYIQDDPVHAGASVTRVTPGGGGYDYPSGYNTTTGCLPAETTDNSALCRTPTTGAATSYVHSLPDGTVENFTLSNGAASFPRFMFLTSVVDPYGNTTSLTYDGTFRLTSITDAMGRSTTFTYGLTAHPLLITKITDPFGRFTQINYDTNRRLSSVTDPIGITSSYTYSTTEPTFVTTLTTPYGTSNFSDAINPNDTPETNTRSLVVTDPLGYSDYLYFYQNPSITPSTDPSNTIPVGLATNDNGLLQWRNTYYWDRHAFALGVTTSGVGHVTSEDFTKARLTHWLHDTPTFPGVGDETGSVKEPLEHRVWLNYPGQSTYDSGTLDLPTFAGRVLDDGSTQLVGATFNTFGLPLTVTDAVGRITKYTYAANNIDLQTVQQLTTSPSTYTTLATYSNYNTQHEAQTYVGPDGLTWKYAYTAAGQIHTVTDPSNIITTYNYDTSNRLSTVVNGFNHTVLTLTYDSADRVQTRTDSEGYQLTYAYDNLDRVTTLTYPDGTTDLFDYTFQSGPLLGTPSLELRKYTDRLGRVTTYAYDADQRRTSVTEPLTSTTTRTTSFDYYENGALKDITDANGNVTHWDIDIESRPTDKIYAYGTAQAKTETYTYENTTSRLKSITDALGQVKTFSYTTDDLISGLTYTSNVNPTPNVTFTYDTYFPRLTSMVDGFGTTSYAYVSVGSLGGLQLLTITPPFNNSTVTLGYDNVSRFQSYAVSGWTDVYSHDSLGRILTHATPVGAFSYTYLGQTDQPIGRSATVGSNTFSTSWGYDTNTNDRRLLTITNSGVTRSFTLGYGTSPVNPYDIMSISDTAASGHPWSSQSHNYTYDESDRLLTASATTPGNFSYGYDPLDNQTTVTTPSGTTNPTYDHLNQISTWGTLSYTYDANGNVLSGDGVKTYKWDAENRLIEIDYVGTSNKDTFAYDGLGHRIQNQHTVSGTTTTTYYGWCGDHICQTRSSVNNPLSFITSEGYALQSGTNYIFMPDQLDSVRDILNASTGALAQSFDYTPYGGIARQTVTPVPGFQYAGLFLDPTSTLNFSATRAQDGVTGRWLGRDPMREFAGPNLYSYVNANPISWVDQAGLAAHKDLLNENNPKDLKNWAKSYKPDDYNTLIVHGTNEGGFAQSQFAGDHPIDSVAAAKALKGETGYDPNVPTLLLACQAGETGGGLAFQKELGGTVYMSTLDIYPPYHPDTQTVWLGHDPVSKQGTGWGPVPWVPVSGSPAVIGTPVTINTGSRITGPGLGGLY
jgi:RHS repeat-associated protein